MDESERAHSRSSEVVGRGSGEEVYFSENGIQITSARAIFPGTTYSMANVTSVSEAFIPPRRFWPIVTIGVGLLALAGQPIVGVLIAAAGVFWWIKRRRSTTSGLAARPEKPNP